MTPDTIITEVRRLLSDTLSPYRYSDDMLLGFVNQAIKRTAMLRPDLFGEIETFEVDNTTVLQRLPEDALRLIDVFTVVGGGAITEVDRETMSRSYPNWMSEDPGTPVNFMRHVKNGTQFFLYPRPSVGTELLLEYAKRPHDYTMSEGITAPPDTFEPALIDCVVFLAESVDNEHVTSGRAKLFLDAFTQALGVNLQSRPVTDTKAAGMKPSADQTRMGEVI